MHLIDNIDFKPALSRPVGHLVTNLADIVHAVVGCRIDLDHIHRSPRRYRSAHRAFPAGAAVRRVFTVHCFGKYFRDRRLPGSPGTAEQIGMTNAVSLNLIL